MYQHSFKIIIFILALCCITLDCNFAYGQKPKPRSSGQQKGATKNTGQKPVTSPKKYSPSGEITFEEFNPYAGSKDTSPVVTLGGKTLQPEMYAENGVIIATEQTCDLTLTYTSKSNMILGTDRKEKQFSIPPTPHYGLDDIYVYFIDPAIKAKTIAERRTYAKNVSFDIVGIGGIIVEVVWYDGFAKTPSGKPKIVGSKKFQAAFPTRPVHVTIPDNITGFSISPVNSCYICNYGIDNLAFGLPLIAGRLRVVDPKDSNKSWNIDKILQGQTEKNTTTVSIIPKDSPDKPVMILSVNKEGKFSSLKAIKGSEDDLVDGKEYFLRASLKYEDHIDVDNTDFYFDSTGCPPPSGNKLLRETIRDSFPFVLKKTTETNIQNADFPLPIILIHGIRTCYSEWSDWLGYLLNSEPKEVQAKYPKGYIVFTPMYKFAEYSRGDAEKDVSRQLDASFKGLSSAKQPNFNIIAHSNGGVITRLIAYDANWKQRINSVYTLGTPHSGSAEWERLFGKYYRLDTKTMARFNKRYPNFNGVKVVAIGGTANKDVDIGERLNDGIVLPQDSVFNIGEIIEVSYEGMFGESVKVKAINPKSVPPPHHFEPEHEFELYHSNRGGRDRPNFLERGREAISMLEGLIFSDMVFSQSSSYVMREKTAYTSEIKPQTDKRADKKVLFGANPLALVYSGEEQLTLGKEKTVEILVTPTAQVQFKFASTTPIDFALVDPLGTAITRDTAKSYVGVTQEVGFLGEYVLTIQNPKTGIWLLKSKATGKEGKFIALVRMRSDLNLLAAIEKDEYAPSSQANLRARIFGNELSNIKVDAVIATVQNDSGKIVNQITLSEKKPYMYQGAVIVPSQIGEYLVTVEARGTEQGNKFQRQFVSEFEVSGEGARQNGVVQDNTTQTQENTPPPQKSNDSFSFALSGNLKTDVEINAGDSVTISASGQVVLGKRVGGCSPEGRETSVYELGSLIVKSGGSGELVARHGALLARINAQGNEKWIIVGSNKTFVAPNSGMLELQVNDKKYEDNQGKFDVQVRINRVK